jgi:Tfp pilus assembly protein PilO
MINLTYNIDPMKLLEELRNRKDIAIAVMAIVAALFISAAVNKNLGQKAAALNRKIADQRKVNASAKKLDGLEAEFEKIKEGMPDEINPYTALQEINKIAADSGDVRLVSVAPAEARDKSIYVEYPFTIKLETQYAALADFVKKLEALKMFTVKSLEASPQAWRGQAAEEEPKLQVTLYLTAIALKK